MARTTHFAVLLTLSLIGLSVCPALAASRGICLNRDPSPPQVVYNDGGGTITFGWTLSFDTHCSGSMLEVIPPTGPAILLANLGCPPAASSFAWTVPAGTAPGNYYGRLSLYSDWAVLPIVPGMMEDQAQVGFVIAGAGRFRICKFNDWDGDGRWDTGEPGLANWQFRIERPAGTLIATAITGSNGFTQDIVLPMVPPNAATTAYWISEVLPSECWTRTTPAAEPFQLNLPQGELGPAIEFGNWQPGRVQFTKFEDTNGNAVRDSGEPLLAGWRFSVRTCPDSAEIATGTTDATGKTPVLVVPMRPGGALTTTYCVREEVPSGSQGCWARTTPSPGPVSQDFTVVVPISCASDPVTSITVGNWQPSALRLYKYSDLNGNCVVDAGEPPLVGWRFDLTRPDGLNASLTTGADGYTPSYTGPAGRYTVLESPPVGVVGCWQNTCGQNPFSVDIAACQSREVSVGNWEPRFRIHKFQDTDGNGERSDDEPWLSGWVFNVTRPDGTHVTVTTGPDGRTPVVAGAAGSYSVEEILQPGWNKTTQSGANPFVVDASDCTVRDILVGNRQTITITGQVRLDLAPWPWTSSHWVGLDGQQNNLVWEPAPLADPPLVVGVTGAQVELWAGATRVKTTVTDATGFFAFGGVQYLPNYIIRQINPGDIPPCDPDIPNSGHCSREDWSGTYVSTVAMSPTARDFVTPDDIELILAPPTVAGQVYGGNYFYDRRPCRIWGIVHAPPGESQPPAMEIAVEKLCGCGPNDPTGGCWMEWVDTPTSCSTCGFYEVPTIGAEPDGIRQGCPTVTCGYRLTAPPPPGSEQSWTVQVRCPAQHAPERIIENADRSVSVELDVDPGADVRVDFLLESEYRKQCNLTVTLTQQDWHNLADQNAPGIPGGMVYNRFATAFRDFVFYGEPSKGRLIVGKKSTISFTPTTSGMSSLVYFLPQTGPYKRITTSYTNPPTTPAGELAGEVVALTLNLAYNDMRLMPRTPGYNLEDFTLSTGLFRGRTVGQVLDIANKILGGDTPQSYGLPDYAALVEILKSINANYQMSDIDSFHDRGYLIPDPTIPRGSHPPPHTPHVP